MSRRALLGRLWRFVKRAILVGGALIALLLFALWIEHLRPVQLPPPTGHFAVGRTVAAWKDGGRPDPLAPPPGGPRELLVWVWYPARRSAVPQFADYLPRFWRDQPDARPPALLRTFVWKDPEQVGAHSIDGAEVAADNARYPVVVFRSGIGVISANYASLAEDLASHGYIVVSADAPYSTWVVVMPDGRVIRKTDEGNPGDARISEEQRDRQLESLLGVWTADTSFLLDRLARLDAGDPPGPLTGRVNLGAIGVVGHSFGGATAAQMCHDDARCRVGIDIDGALYGSVAREGMAQPFMFLLSDHGDLSASPEHSIFAAIRRAARRNPSDSLIVTLRGAHHFSFSDYPLIQSRILGTAASVLAGQGAGLDPREGLDVTSRYVRGFLDVHLRGAPRHSLYSRPLVPEVRLEAK